jgi:hypothetical protein
MAFSAGDFWPAWKKPPFLLLFLGKARRTLICADSPCGRVMKGFLCRRGIVEARGERRDDPALKLPGSGSTPFQTTCLRRAMCLPPSLDTPLLIFAICVC